MKGIILFLILISFISCKPKDGNIETTVDPSVSKENFLGKELFEGEGNCVACHQPNQKIIGPSMEEIAKIYKSKNASIVLFLKGEREPIVDPSQYEIMKTNFAITKSMNEDELKSLEDYIYSFSK